MRRVLRRDGGWPARIFVALSLGGILTVASIAHGAVAADRLRTHGLLPVEPRRPAADFTLPRFDGGEASLSDFQGTWVVLTFWASWCGPCRAEMPSLERLHRARAGAGVTVLGVSVDENRAAAESFAGQLGLTFPLLWDVQGQVGGKYQAVAIPVSYIVDPQAQIVAVARGARDWTELTSLLDALTEESTPHLEARANYADSLDLPMVLDPPTAELELSNPLPRVGQEFFLEIRLQWVGRLEEYVPQPPKVNLPDGVTQLGVTASTDSRDGARVVRYRVRLQADRPGSYALDPVELRYTPRLAASETASRVVGPTVEVRHRTWAGLQPRTLALSLGGLLVTVVVSLAVGRRWRSSRRAGLEPERTGHEVLRHRFNHARGLRLQGDGAGFALAMLDLLEELCRPGEVENEELSRFRESLRYGGEVPPTAELDRIQRLVERRLEAMRPDPDAAARVALRLQD